ncbi:MAG: hypothetical protein K0U16_07360 [Gammaproteobacteria bacterium]|nr:hypothetical protein [Gammaproteobacteria bacterium]
MNSKTGENVKSLLRLLGLVSGLLSVLVGFWMFLNRPDRPEGPCLEKRTPKDRSAPIECTHSDHRMVENDEIVWCRCQDGATEG